MAPKYPFLALLDEWIDYLQVFNVALNDYLEGKNDILKFPNDEKTQEAIATVKKFEANRIVIKHPKPNDGISIFYSSFHSSLFFLFIVCSIHIQFYLSNKTYSLFNFHFFKDFFLPKLFNNNFIIFLKGKQEDKRTNKILFIITNN